MKFSDLAKPPISQKEAEKAPHSICFAHGATRLFGWHNENRVFYCPLGKSFWRVNRKEPGMYGPLPYQHSGVI